MSGRSDPAVSLKARCALCAAQAACAAAGATRPEYPDCQAPLRPVSLEGTRELLQWITAFHRVEDPRVDALLEVLLERFARDRYHYSEILEPSFSLDPDGLHLLRFSYGFPGFGHDPPATGATIAALAAPFGDEVARWMGRLLGLADHASVEQPIFGLAYDAPDRWRLKLYLQFRSPPGKGPLSMVRRLTGCTGLTATTPGGELHMLGVDLADRGLVQAKLYFRHPRVQLADTRDAVGEVALADYLAVQGLAELRDLLAVHPVAGPGAAVADRPAWVDFALAPNELRLVELLPAPTFRRLGGPEEPIGQLWTRFAVALRRVSVPVGRRDKLNGYYVLTALDPDRGHVA